MARRAGPIPICPSGPAGELSNSIVVYSANGKVVSGTARNGPDSRGVIVPSSSSRAAAILVNAKPPAQPATSTSLESNVSSSASYPP